MKLYYLVTLGLLCPTILCAGDDLEVDKSYRLEKTIQVAPLTDDYQTQGCQGAITKSDSPYAGKVSKFKVQYQKQGTDCYVIRFRSVFANESTDSKNLVKEDVDYLLPSQIHGVPIRSSVSDFGETSGLLVVPFKYREDDKSISGEATVGYYAGFDMKWGTLVGAAGLTQVSIPVSDTETENQSAITLAGGVLIKNWDGLEMGLIVGVDHIGGTKGDSWQYEDDLWYSLMIGWNFGRSK